MVDKTLQPVPHAGEWMDVLVPLLHKITKGGGLHGNPYCIAEVTAALKMVARQQRITDWLDVRLDRCARCDAFISDAQARTSILRADQAKLACANCVTAECTEAAQ